jgi:hypothetical protein
MRLTKYLTEGTKYFKVPYEIELEDAVKMIEKDCSQVLRVYKAHQKVFFRGVDSGTLKGTFLKKTPHKNRRPLSTNLAVHMYMNEYLKKKFGWPVRNGVSVSSDANQAEAYGHIHMFIPANGFKYAWNPYVHDLYNEIPIRRPSNDGTSQAARWLY